MKLITLITLLMTCAAINAQVFSYVDPNGNTIYTDNPPKQQQTRELNIELTPSAQPTQTNTNHNATRTIRLSPNNEVASFDKEAINNLQSEISSAPFTIVNNVESYQSIDIIKPLNEESIRNSGGKLTIEIKSIPPLMPNHQYRFLIDGQTVGESTSSSFEVANLDRGEHTLIVEVVNVDKHVIEQSKEQLFFIKQTSLAEKRRIHPCLIREYGIRPECPLKDKPKPQPRNLLLRVTDSVGVTSPKKE